jgi:serine/threonine-protein kinase
MVTGRHPFPEKGIDAVLKAHLEQELTPPDHVNPQLSSGLGEVVEFMMAKKRNQRYSNADELIGDLECLLNGEPPKLARQRIEAGMLRQLAEGDEDDEENEDEESASSPAPALNGLPWLWVGALGAVLLLSLAVNVLLLLARR